MAVSDYGDVGCEHYRESLSARLDGEQEAVDPAVLDAHLAGCPECRQWLEHAATVTRLTRTGPAPTGIDVTDSVLPAAPGRGRSRAATALRVALGVLGVAQLVLGLVQTTALRPVQETHVHGTTVDGATTGHLWHESAAWNLAVGAAFLWVAARRGRSVGILPILTVFIGVLALLSVADVVAGRVEAARLASHTFVLTGYLVALVLARVSLDLPPPVTRRAGRWRRAAPAADSPATADPPGPAGHGGRVVPIRDPDRSQPAARTDRREAA